MGKISPRVQELKQQVIVDPEDLDIWDNGKSWTFDYNSEGQVVEIYASRRAGCKSLKRLIYQRRTNETLPSNLLVKYRNGNALDNRFENLYLLSRNDIGDPRSIALREQVMVDPEFESLWNGGAGWQIKLKTDGQVLNIYKVGVGTPLSRVVYELSTGQPIPDNQVVKFVDKNPLNNRYQNLYLIHESDDVSDLALSLRCKVLIDPEFESLWNGGRYWRFSRLGNHYYVVGTPNHPEHAAKSLHRVIYEIHTGELIPDGYVIDHANRNPLDNRVQNLRLATKSQNAANSKRLSNSTTPYRGVSQTRSKKWKAAIKSGCNCIGLGVFSTPEEAARAYDAAAKDYFGEFASLNFPEVG
jgi:hypothetical protein